MRAESGIMNRWVKIALVNFVVVALAGTFLRYKVGFSLPFVDFKKLLHAHSHFAFAGWVSMALFALLIGFFLDEEQQKKKTYRVLFWLSQVFSYGMLFSFLWQEYGPVSITFSTAYVFVTYVFAFCLWRDTRKERTNLAVRSLRAALIFLVLSSLGPYMLAYIIASHSIDGALYHNAIYWYLHFQYNGWFSFAVFAIFMKHRERLTGEKENGFAAPFRLLLVSCVPAYLLSVLWVIPPLWVFWVAGMAAALQVAAFGLIVQQMLKIKRERKGLTGVLFLLSFISLSIKLTLQFLLVFPELNQFVFGHRPVIIGYLHLVMLGFVSFFIFAVSISEKIFSGSATARAGVWIFITGVLLNETGLMLQGFSSILIVPMNWIPLVLVIASVTMFTGLAVFAFCQRRKNISARAVEHTVVVTE